MRHEVPAIPCAGTTVDIFACAAMTALSRERRRIYFSGFLTCICFPPDFLYFPEATIR
jgi:hypothetical protein